MNTAKPTPGPWRIARFSGSGEAMRENDGAWMISGPDGPVGRATMQAAAKRGQGHSTPDPEGEANARLIAAAPELLEALRRLRDYNRGEPCPMHPRPISGKGCECAVNQASDAIAKATGDSA